MTEKNPYLNDPELDFTDLDEMDKKAAQREMGELREAIRHHNYLYYIKNQPVISDATYDALFARLEDLEKEFPALQSENSPTVRIGTEPVDELTEIQHQGPMLSLDSTRDKEEVERFFTTVTGELDTEKWKFSLEPKLDGLSIELVYEQGEFVYGATRGDGKGGEDITNNLKTVKPIPLKLRDDLKIPAQLALRGELMMPKEGFQDLNRRRIEKNKEPYANPRNAAAGLIRQLDSRQVADKPFTVYFYDILAIEGVELDSQADIFKALPKWGCKTNPENQLLVGKSVPELVNGAEAYHQGLLKRREDLGYDIDGVVIKLSHLESREQLGNRERSPRWAKAWKFPPRRDITLLKAIIVQVGRTGMLTPVALLEPVDVGGVTVSRATLHTERDVQKKRLHPGVKVRIERAGDVIPEVAEKICERERDDGEENFTMPDRCPVCDTPVVEEGAYYFCPAGLSCNAQLAQRIAHYSSRDALDIRHLGEKVAEMLVEQEKVSDIADIYFLEKEDLLELEGFANKSANNLYQAIQHAKDPSLDRLIYGLGIRHVGSHLARVLAFEYPSLEKLTKKETAELEELDEIGPKIATSVSSFFHADKNRKILDKLQSAGVKAQPLKRSTREELVDKTFVFTGKLENYTRDEAKKIVEAQGGEATASISSNTDYLVVGENPGQKLKDAREQKVTIIDEDSFRELIGEIE